MKNLLISAITLLPLSSAMAQGNIVLNGDFESGFGGWLGTYGYIDRANFAYNGSHVGVVMDLRSSSVNQTMYQPLSTEPNQQYQLRFSLLSGAGRAGEQSPPGASPVRVTWGGNVIGTLWNGSVSDWVSYEFLVQATSAETRLGFQSLGTRFQLIDGISVAAVPEPPLLTLVAAGTAALLTEGIRKRRKAMESA